MAFEYNVIPAPARAEKSKQAKTPADRFTLTLTDVLNDMAREGWEYLRAEVLPSDERSGLASRTTVYHNMLVFRRPKTWAPVVQADKETALPLTPKPVDAQTAAPAIPASAIPSAG